MVGAEEVPGVEAREVLECAKDFVAADCRVLLAMYFGRGDGLCGVMVVVVV